METVPQIRKENLTSFHFERSRLNDLFKNAVRYPLVVVCAGAGYGKTSAVHDFAQECGSTTAWVQLSERDNVASRFWENFIHSLALISVPYSRSIAKPGFPDTPDKMKRYTAMINEHVEIRHRILVMDDFHYIEDPSVIRFVEGICAKIPPNASLFLISRSTPRINIAGLISRNQIFNISENDLRFTDNEFFQYFRGLNISFQPDDLRCIMRDTEGWAFAINLIARSYQKAPGYSGYLQSAMKMNIFRLMETEIWDGISKLLQYFLIRLSLIDHLSVDLIILLVGENVELIDEMEKQNAYVRRDSYINAYIIHPLFLEFLRQKQELLSEEDKRETYTIAGKWCNSNGFRFDALSYYEKIGDYKSIVLVFEELPAQIPPDIAKYAMEIMERAPVEAFDTVEGLAIVHLRSYMCQGLWQKSIELAEYYEAKFLKLSESDLFAKRSLGSVYYCWYYIRSLLCLTDDRYDHSLYFEKFVDCVSKPVEPHKMALHCPGFWLTAVGSSREGAVEECIDNIIRAVTCMSRRFDGRMGGLDELARGEVKFFQGDIRAAEYLITRALDRAREKRQFEVEHRALLYILRIAVSQGDYAKAEQALKETKAHLDEDEYINRFTNYDISLSWYYCILGLPEKVADWLKENFTPYVHAAFIENSGNQIKARFFYSTRDYPPLLSYIHEMKQRESYLLGRIEMLAIEACIHYKMKNKEKALVTLSEAYQTALTNDIVMPFIEMGKDMRTLTNFVLKEKNSGIPRPWLESINRKAASYAKRQAHVVVEYKKAEGIIDNVVFSPRETDILTDLSHGLSRVEIAASRNLSVNTVKMVINSIYMKAGAENLADLIRIAVERKLI
jgi:LuxR family maltose regulon positive regulatory protein